jgi:hypothetical protein
MAGGFVGTSTTPKDRGNYSKGPKGGKQCTEKGGPFPDNPEYPITDDFARRFIPDFAERHRNTNAKSGFNTTPARPPAGRLAQPVTEVVREAGKEIGRDERQRDANSEGSLFVKTEEFHKKGTELRKRPERF